MEYIILFNLLSGETMYSSLMRQNYLYTLGSDSE